MSYDLRGSFGLREGGLGLSAIRPTGNIIVI